MQKKINISGSVRNLEVLAKTLVDSKMLGKYASVFKGQGLEFDSFRDYTSNDDASMIDWKASKRANKTLIKENVEERNLDIFMLIDVSSTMLYGLQKKRKYEYAAELSASLGFAILKAGDSLGYALFSDNIKALSLPETGLSQFYGFSRQVVNPKNYGGKDFDLAGTLMHLIPVLKGGAILFIISDFIGLTGKWESLLKVASQKYDMIGLMIRDPLDRELPKENFQFVLEDPYTEQQLIIRPSKIGADYKRHSNAMVNKIEHEFRRLGSDFAVLNSDKGFVKPIITLFKRRADKFR